jgi:predicted nucleic-acid-binding protein
MRRTVDTNVLVRALVNDGSEQSQIATTCMANGTIHVPATVILETEWVLRTRFRATRDDVGRVFRVLVGMSNVEFDDRAVIVNAIVAHAKGLDFVDALHLYGAGASEQFVTFDQRFRRLAAKLPGAVTIAVPEQDASS